MKGIGNADINITEMIAGSAGTWIITYEAGSYGIDDGGEILIARRNVCDSDIPQFDTPCKPGYVKVSTDADAVLKVSYIHDRYIRPWKSCISIKATDGSLKKGDRIFIQYGADKNEGMGYRIQTFTEMQHQFKVLVDCAGSGDFYEVENSPAIRITGGYLQRAEAVAPSGVKQGVPFSILVRALDSWGNIAEKHRGLFYLRIGNNENTVEIKNGIGRVNDISIDEAGVYYPEIKDKDNELVGNGNPIICKSESEEICLYWGDMHGQTEETVGTGTPDHYFSFGRDKAGLDFSAWQGNDFQVTDDTWENVCRKVKEYHVPGKFVTFLGYEWSGTIPAGGDYNIYYLNDDQPIYRSYGWQIGMNNNGGTDRNPLPALWEEFKGRKDVMGIPHVGGRHGNLDFCNEELVHLLEIHSHHGTFEWFFEDALRKGLKLGIIAASDDHTCRPGLTFPVRATSRGSVTSFPVRGGLTGVYTKELTRESLWDAFHKRHCYGTTGERILLDVSCGDRIMGDEFSVYAPPKIQVKVAATDIISDIIIKRGLEDIYFYSDTLPIKKDTVKIQWSGVLSKNRKKMTRWDGRLSIDKGRIKKVEPFAFNQPDEGVTVMSNQIIEWKSGTSGDIDGIEVELEADAGCELAFCSLPISFGVKVDELEKGRIVRNSGEVNQRVEISFARQETEKEARIELEDRDIRPGLNPYWVKVILKNGHMAWSSPMYINLK